MNRGYAVMKKPGNIGGLQKKGMIMRALREKGTLYANKSAPLGPA